MIETFGPVRQLVDRGRAHYRNLALGCYAVALALAGITAYVSGWSFYRAGPMVLVGLLAGVGAIYHAWYRRLRWSRHPVLIALETDPAEIIDAIVTNGAGLGALGNDRFVTISISGAAIMLTVHRRELPAIAAALRAHCPSAELIGFPP